MFSVRAWEATIEISRAFVQTEIFVWELVLCKRELPENLLERCADAQFQNKWLVETVIVTDSGDIISAPGGLWQQIWPELINKFLARFWSVRKIEQ